MSNESTDNIDESESLNTKLPRGGAIRPTEAERAKIPLAPRLMSSTVLLDSVDLKSNFPPVGNQGDQNSCVGWAVAYALKTYQEQMERNWGVDTSQHQFSPAFIYNLRSDNVNGDGEDKGMRVSEAMDIVVEKGVCTLLTMPYKQNDCNTIPNDAQKAEAIKYRGINVDDYWIDYNVISTVKQYLFNGTPVIILMPIYPDLDNLKPSNPIYDNLSGICRGYHAVCIVGYDDNYQHGNTKGVFKFINSWGTSKGIDGYGYIAYSLIEDKPSEFDFFVLFDKIDVTGITLSTSSMELTIGERQSLSSTISPANASNTIVDYTSNNTGVATISPSGEVYAAGIGTTTINAESDDPDSNASASCHVTVKNASISLNASNITLYLGESKTLSKTVSPSNSITESVTWNSSNPAVATINGSTGEVKASSPGETTISVKCNYANSSATATCSVKVKDASISLNASNITLYIGESKTLTKTVSPSNSITESVTWNSSNPAVATINGSTGEVKAISPGETTISVKCNYANSNASASCHVTVKDINDSLFISDTIPTKAVAGRTYHVSITLKNIGITNWTTNQESVAGNYCLGTDVNNNTNGPLFLNGSDRIMFPTAITISPGEIYLVNFQMKIPEAVGTYKLNFKMLNSAAVWFGAILEKKIVVNDPDDESALNTYGFAGTYNNGQLAHLSHYTIRNERFWLFFNTYGSTGTFKHDELKNYSHYAIRTQKFKNQYYDLYDFTYSQMQAKTQNQLREGEL